MGVMLLQCLAPRLLRHGFEATWLRSDAIVLKLVVQKLMDTRPDLPLDLKGVLNYALEVGVADMRLLLLWTNY